MPSKQGSSKKRKGDQPKRKRYNVSRRGYKKRFNDLEKHIAKNPNDAIAKESVSRVKALVTK